MSHCNPKRGTKTEQALTAFLKFVGSLACGALSLVNKMKNILRKKKMFPAMQMRPGRYVIHSTQP